MTRVVMITKFLPLPADSGGKQRSLAVLQRLARVADVTVCAFDDGAADHAGLGDLGVRVVSAPRPGWADAARGVVRHRSVSAGRFASAALLREIRRTTETPPDALLVAYGQLAPYASVVQARRKVLDLHNVESALLSSYAATARGLGALAARFESRAMGRIERRAMEAYDTVAVVSELDRARLPGPHPDVLVCPNGWEPGSPLPAAHDPVVAFVGLMGWTPNADAATWLATAVWPHVRARMPEARLALVGRDPGPSVRALAGADVEVTGTVPSVAPHLERARVAVAPLRAGGGSRLKILEALNAGRPVVATTVGAEGLEPLVGRGVVIADDERSFAEAVLALLRDPEAATALGQAGNAAIAELYSWDRSLAPLIDAVTAP